MPLKAPSVDAILVALDVELDFGLPDIVLPEEVLPGEVLVGEGVELDERTSISYTGMVNSLQHYRLTCFCVARSTAPQQRPPQL